MSIHRTFLLTLGFVALSGCATFSSTPKEKSDVVAVPATIQQLLLTPEDFSGKVVNLTGAWNRGIMKSGSSPSMAILYGGFDNTLVLLSTDKGSTWVTLLLDKAQVRLVPNLMDLEGKAVAVENALVEKTLNGTILKPSTGFSLGLMAAP
jgi:hypothetical protein